MLPIGNASYLKRIRCRRVPGNAVHALRTLHRRHLMSVPFENLDVLRGIPLGTNRDAVLDKVVTRSRGGLCFELNRAFHWLLAELGFRVTLAGAEVAHGEEYFTGIPHPVLIVAAGADMWLADVGFGAISFVDPVRLTGAASQRRFGERRRFGVRCRIDIEDGYRVVRIRPADLDWQTLFRFTTAPMSWADSQVALTNRRLTVLRRGHLSEIELDPGDPAYHRALAWILHGDGELAKKKGSHVGVI